MTNGFKIIGISIRTTNRNNKAQQDLANLWGQFYAENILDKIPNKVSDNISSFIQIIKAISRTNTQQL